MTMLEQTIIDAVRQRVQAARDEMLEFFREIVAIPSTDSQIRNVGERVAEQMQKLGYDAVWWDQMGNLIGRIGSEDADVILLYDSHLDTVGVGDPNEWDWDPFEGKVEDGVLYARGACDEKASTPGMLYGLVIARDLGLLPQNLAAYYFGNIEEVNEGASANAFVMTEGIRPDYVVIGEPTDMQLSRGQKGRAEYEITVKGKSAHAASAHLGDNALYRALPVIEAIKARQHDLPNDDFLGQGRITVTDCLVQAGSRNVVPGAVTVVVDRRLTAGEDAYAEAEALRELLRDHDVEVEIPVDEEPSYTGFVFPLDKIYPAWVLPEDHTFVQAGLQLAEALGWSMQAKKWDFSTNGVYWAGKASIPSIGFGPGEEQYAHTVLDQVRLEDIVRAT